MGRVPAWKRLGLKLKAPASQSEPSVTPSTISTSGSHFRSSDEVDSSKRKRQPYNDTPAARPSLKKPRTDDRQFNSSPLARQKSVTFASEASSDKQQAPVAKRTDKAPAKKKKKPAKKPKAPKPQPPAPPPDLTGALDYLRRWKTSRDTWKFNKNHQTQLINHVFDSTLVPAADIGIFYEYIRDLKGYIRTRLVETAKDIQASDMEKGKDNFPSGTSDVELKEEQYQQIMSGLLHHGSPTSKRKRFDEMEFTQENTDAVIARRVAKRMRAEMIVDELSSSDSDESTITTTTTSTTEKEPAPKDLMDESDDSEKRVKLNDGATRPAKRIRASKRRGADLDDDSSSSDSSSEDESEEESDEDSSSESSSSSGKSSGDDDSDDSDDNMELDAEQDTSSSSSSSSSDESDSDDEQGGS